MHFCTKNQHVWEKILIEGGGLHRQSHNIPLISHHIVPIFMTISTPTTPSPSHPYQFLPPVQLPILMTRAPPRPHPLINSYNGLTSSSMTRFHNKLIFSSLASLSSCSTRILDSSSTFRRLACLFSRLYSSLSK